MRSDRLLTSAAFLLAAILLAGRLGELPLIQPDEGRNAEVAREMKESGAWLVPTFNGLPYLDKPSFYFKTVALSFAAFGVNEGAARLPSALFALGLLGLLFAFLRREWGQRTAALAVVVVVTSPLFLAFARMVIFDMALSFFVAAAVLAASRAEEVQGREQRLWYLLGAAASAGATLVKGPVGFIVPSLVVLAVLLMERRRGSLGRVFAPLNLLVFFGLTLPWFLGVAHRHPDFVHYGLVEETLRRYSTTAFHRTAPFYYYGPVLLGVFYPWSVLLPEGMVAALRSRRNWLRTERLLVVWALLVVLFFSTSQSKLPGYILTAVVALGALTARLFGLALEDSRGRAARLVLRGTLTLALLSAAAAGLLSREVAQPGWLERVFHIHSSEFDRLEPVFPPVALVLGTIALTGVLARLLRNVRLALAVFLLFPLSLPTVSFEGLAVYAEASSSRALAARIPPLPAGTEIASLRSFPIGLPFYLRRPVTLLTENGSELTSNYVVYALRRAARWPEGVVPIAEAESWLAGRQHPVYMMARPGSRATLESMAAPAGMPLQDLGSGWWGTLILPSGGAP